MMLAQEKEKLTHKFMQTQQGWERLAAAMVMPLKTRYGYFTTLGKILDHPRSDTPVQTRSMLIDVTPQVVDLDHSMDLMKAWMLEAEKPTIQDFFQQSTKVSEAEFLYQWGTNPAALVNAPMHVRVRKMQEPRPHQQIFTTPFAPPDQVALFERGSNTRGGWRLVDLAIEVKDLLAKDEATGRCGARLEVTMSWQDDHLPGTSYIIEP